MKDQERERLLTLRHEEVYDRILKENPDAIAENWTHILGENLIKLEDDLLEILDEEFEAYLDECDLDEDRGVDSADFARHAKEMIEHEHGKVMFSVFDIEKIAAKKADSNQDALFERAVDAGDLAYEMHRESQWEV